MPTWGRVPSPVRRSEAPLPCHVPDIAELWLGRPDVGVWAYVVRTRANRLLVLLQISATTYVGTGALTRPAERSSAISAMFPNIAELWLGAQTWASGPTWFVPVQTVCSSSCRFCLDTRGDGCPHPSGGAKLRSPAMFRILPSFASAAQTWASGPYVVANRLLVLLQISAATYVGTGALTRPAERSSAPPEN